MSNQDTSSTDSLEPETTTAEPTSADSLHRPWYQRLGPGLITACVVIGPGSITTSSSVGADYGYAMLWVVVVAVFFMLVYMSLGARLGSVAKESPCDLVRQHAGRWLAILVGLSVFFIATAFQSGNNIGVASAFEAFFPRGPMIVFLVILFNAIAITFLFAFKNLYRMLERVMMTFVGLMLISFAINLFLLKPDVTAMAAGLWPEMESLNFAVLGLIGTTFVSTAAFYQAYLVRQKGWNEDQVRSGLVDARIGSIVMAAITIMLMSTAAAGLYTGKPMQLTDVVAIAEALERTFGTHGKVIFCIGLFSAAYSSFIVNSMIGGFIAADGLGLGSKADDLAPRVLSAIALLTGMAIALAAMFMGFDRAPTIIAAQAVTVAGAPLVAGVLLWLTSRHDVMGRHVNGSGTKILASIGFVMLLVIAGYTAFVRLPESVRKYRAKPAAKQIERRPASSEFEIAIEPQRGKNFSESFIRQPAS